MAAWVTIYLAGELPDLRTASIRQAISDADWYTLAEQFDIEEDAVAAFRAAITWSDEPLEIRHEGRRPVQFHVWTDAARVREEIEELAENTELPASVSTHLQSVRAIVALEMGFSQLETMFEILAFEIAYWLAGVGHGLIRGPNDAWFDHRAHRWKPIEA